MPVKKTEKQLEPVNQKPVNKLTVHTLDATGKILGRLSTEAANLLRGKGKVDFEYHRLMGDKVVIINAKDLQINQKKLVQKEYHHHTGYMGHLKTKTMADIYRSDPKELIYRSIYGMLPKNKLRDKWMKNLVIYNGAQDATSK